MFVFLFDYFSVNFRACHTRLRVVQRFSAIVSHRPEYGSFLDTLFLLQVNYTTFGLDFKAYAQNYFSSENKLSR